MRPIVLETFGHEASGPSARVGGLPCPALLGTKDGFMDIAIPEDTETRAKMISNVFASPKHLAIFRALTRMGPWASVAQIVKRTKISKRTVYRIVKDFRKAGILEGKTISRRKAYRLAESIRWVGTLIEEPKVVLNLSDVPERSRLRQLLAEDKLARQVVGYLLDAPGPLTLRQLSAQAGAWAIEVKARLNRLIDEGLVLKRDLEYSVNREVASELLREVTR